MSKKSFQSIIFVASLASIFVALYLLSTCERPKRLPTDTTHQLTHNHRGKPVAFAHKNNLPPIPWQITQDQILRMDRPRQLEQQCIACHGVAQNTQNPTASLPKECADSNIQKGSLCLGEHHPPKNQCLKCHQPENY